MHFHIFFNERLNTLWAVSRDCDMQVMDDGHSLSMPVIHKDKRDRSSLIGWRRFEGYTELIEMTIEQSSILHTMKLIKCILAFTNWPDYVFNDKPGSFGFDERREVLVQLATSDLDASFVRSVRNWLATNPTDEEWLRAFVPSGKTCFF